MDFFRIISFIQDIKVRTPNLVALFQEFFSMRYIMDRMLGDLQAGDDLLIISTEIEVFRNLFLVLPVLQE
jgi:hypothetical protein